MSVAAKHPVWSKTKNLKRSLLFYRQKTWFSCQRPEKFKLRQTLVSSWTFNTYRNNWWWLTRWLRPRCPNDIERYGLKLLYYWWKTQKTAKLFKTTYFSPKLGGVKFKYLKTVWRQGLDWRSRFRLWIKASHHLRSRSGSRICLRLGT